MTNREKDFVNYPTFDEKFDRTKFAANGVMEQNPSAAQATNFDTKNERLRQINPLKEAKLTTNLEQAENFADKKSVIAPDEKCVIFEKRLTKKPPKKMEPSSSFRENPTTKD